MTTTPIMSHDPTHPPSRSALEKQAEETKDRLLHTLEKLDHRRHQAVETVQHVRRDLVVAAVVGGVLLALTLGEIQRRRASRKSRAKSAIEPYRARWLAFRRAWTNPERVAATDEGARDGARMGGGDFLEKVAVKALGAAASFLFARLVQKRSPDASGSYAPVS